MNIVVTILHIFACFILILVVLLQAGKGANMGAAFGGSSQTIFGSSGAGTFLGKMTTMVAAIFMLTSLTLSYFSLSKGGSSLMEGAGRQTTKKAAPSTVPQKPVAPKTQPGATTPQPVQPGAKK